LSSFDQIKAKIKELLKNKSDKVKYATKHIEVDRAYREISIKDVQQVLASGKVVGLAEDHCIEWKGKDIDGREIKLLCRMRTADGENTFNILSAEYVFVGTAYHSSKADDKKIRKQWLLNNPDWRENSQGYVERKNGKK
jgi:hypothetical protein